MSGDASDSELDDADLGEALLQAAREGDLERVVALLTRGAAVDYCDKAGNTPLLAAAERGWAEIVSDLLALGADFEHENDKRQSATFLAATCPQRRAPGDPADWVRHRGHDETLRLLLKPRLRDNGYDIDGYSALELAADAGNIAAVLDLLEYGDCFPVELWGAYKSDLPAKPELIEALANLLGDGWLLGGDWGAKGDGEARPYQGWTPLADEDVSRREPLLAALLGRALGYGGQAELLIEERIDWLEACGEEAYERMYDARGSSAAGCYSEAKGFFDDARGLARRIGQSDRGQRLNDRLDHIKAVFRSQFS